MKSRVRILKSTVLSLLQPKSVLIGVAAFNFMVFYLAAKSAEGMMFCFGSPWYTFERFGHFPLLLLVAAAGLYLGQRWGYLVGLAFSTPVVYQMAVDFMLAASFYEWWVITESQSGLGFQYILALTIPCLSSAAMARVLTRRGLSLP